VKKTIERILKAHGLWADYEKAAADRSYRESFAVRLKNPPYQNLVIECHGDGRVCVGHYFIQNGDVMYDPEIVFQLPDWLAAEITQHPMGVYARAEKGREKAFRRSLQELIDLWVVNLVGQMWHDPDEVTVEVL